MKSLKIFVAILSINSLTLQAKEASSGSGEGNLFEFLFDPVCCILILIITVLLVTISALSYALYKLSSKRTGIRKSVLKN